jgi:hypothetical protein
MLHTSDHFRWIHRRFIAHCYRRGHLAAATRVFCMLRSQRPPGSSCGPSSSSQAGGGGSERGADSRSSPTLRLGRAGLERPQPARSRRSRRVTALSRPHPRLDRHGRPADLLLQRREGAAGALSRPRAATGYLGRVAGYRLRATRRSPRGVERSARIQLRRRTRGRGRTAPVPPEVKSTGHESAIPHYARALGTWAEQEKVRDAALFGPVRVRA